MTMHLEPENVFSDRKTQTNAGLGDITTQLEQALKENKRGLEEAEIAFESADEEAFHATANAEESEKAYKANHELLETLRAEEENMRNATELAAALANDASMMKTDRDTNYSDLLNQAMNALVTVSTNAEQELAFKQNQREEAEDAGLRLRLQMASTQLSAYMASLRRSKAEHNRLHATNSLFLIENQHKLAKTRSELGALLQNIAKQRVFLDETLSAYYQAIRDAEQLSAEETQHKEKLEQLNRHLSLSSAEIIPFETLVNDLKHEESNLQEAYGEAEKEASLAEQQEARIAEDLESASQCEQELQQSSAQLKSEMLTKNAEQLEEAERNLQSAAAALANATDLAEQSHQELENQEAQIPLQENENALRKEALEKARNTAGETARMVVNVQAIKSAIRGNPASALSSAEVVLQNILQTTNDMVEEKQQAYNESKQLLEEMKEKNRFLRQAAEEAEQAKNALQVIYKGVNADYQRIVEQIRRSETQFQATTERELNEAHLRRLSISESWEVAQKKATEKRKIAEEIREKLEEVQSNYSKAIQSRDQTQKQINELNARIELEKMQATADREHQIIFLWEQSKELHLHAKETGLQLKRNIENAQKLSYQEQRLGLSLMRIVQQANEQIVNLYAKNSRNLGNAEEMISNLKEALDSYRKNPRLRQSGYDETLYTASKLLTSSELSSLDTLEEPIPYQIEIGEYIKLDPELILNPIPQVDGDAQIELEPIDIEKFVKEKESRVEALFSAEREYALEELAQLTETVSSEEEELQQRATEAAAPAEQEGEPALNLNEKEPKAVQQPAARSTSSSKLLEELMTLMDMKPEEALEGGSEEAGETVEEHLPTEPAELDQQPMQPERQIAQTEAEAAAPQAASSEGVSDAAAAVAEVNEMASAADESKSEEKNTEVAETATEEKAQKELDAEEELAKMLLDIEALKNSIEEMEKASAKAAEEEQAAKAAESPADQIGQVESSQLAKEISSLRSLIQQEDAKEEAAIAAEPVESAPAEVVETTHEEEIQEPAAKPTKETAKNSPMPAEESPQEETAAAQAEKELLSAFREEEVLPRAEVAQPGKEEPELIQDPVEAVEEKREEERHSEKETFAPPIDTKASSLADEISNLRNLLGGVEGEHLSLMGTAAEDRDAESAARRESERLRREEEAAQRKAEELAAAKAAEEQKAASEESARLTRLAEEAARSLESKQRQEAKPEKEIKSPLTAAREENEDDLEAELRRLIFSNFK